MRRPSSCTWSSCVRQTRGVQEMIARPTGLGNDEKPLKHLFSRCFEGGYPVFFFEKTGFLFAFARGACYIISCLICGEMAEWSKAQHWKCCIGATLSWVQIPLSPPFLCSNYGILPHFSRFFLEKRPRSCILCRNLSYRLDQYDHETPKKRTCTTDERITR